MESTKEFISTNNATIIGTITSDFRFSHEVFGEKFYEVTVSVKRLSGTLDHVPVIIPERFSCIKEANPIGRYLKVTGSFRSYNKWSDELQRNRVLFMLFAKTITFITDSAEMIDANYITLTGTICKAPVFRITPRKKKVTDLLLAVNRPYSLSDYIPCIC